MTPHSFNDKKQRMTQHSFIVKTARRHRRSRRRRHDGVKGNPPFRNPDSKSTWLQKWLWNLTGSVRNLSEPTETLDETQTLQPQYFKSQFDLSNNLCVNR